MKAKIALFIAISVFSLQLEAMSCTCTKGKMIVEIKDGVASFHCTDGGQVSCSIQVIE